MHISHTEGCSEMSARRSSGRWKCIIAIAIVTVVLAASFWAYTAVYYHCDQDMSKECMKDISDVKIQKSRNGTLIFEGNSVKAGIIFYPGAKVEYTAYQPLMAMCAERGFRCYLLEMPLNLAILDTNAADDVISECDDIDDWYICGHSLGGAIAAKYVADHTDKAKGLILLSAYSIYDLSEVDVKVLSIYGSEDRVLDRKKYESNTSNLPASFAEHVIEGGCHSYFGTYGIQSGDGSPTIANKTQIEITANIIAGLLKADDN